MYILNHFESSLKYALYEKFQVDMYFFANIKRTLKINKEKIYDHNVLLFKYTFHLFVFLQVKRENAKASLRLLSLVRYSEMKWKWWLRTENCLPHFTALLSGCFWKWKGVVACLLSAKLFHIFFSKTSVNQQRIFYTCLIMENSPWIMSCMKRIEADKGSLPQINRTLS